MVKVSQMNKEFCIAYRTMVGDLEWLALIGCPMLYDGSLCVNRTLEEVEYHSKYKYRIFLEFDR